MTLFYGWSSTDSWLKCHYEVAVYFLSQVPRSSWYSFDQPWKDERVS